MISTSRTKYQEVGPGMAKRSGALRNMERARVTRKRGRENDPAQSRVSRDATCREREREREDISIYIEIYIERDREGGRERERAR